ncbi:DapH/DapD/GlmU-related protein [Verrucomicrobiota bacterium]
MKNSVKVKSMFEGTRQPGFRKYRELFYGKTSLWYVLKAEFVMALMGSIPGALGLFLRRKCYRPLLSSAGRQIFIGKNVTFRHPKKIRLGNNVIIDDNCVIDAKGENNAGIVIEDNVFIGRNTIIYCKNGNIHLKRAVNISSNCTVFASNKLTVEEDTVIGAYTYLLSGGEYDYSDTETKFTDQSGMKTKGELVIGRNCWIGARVTILDGACVGEHCVIGAGAVVAQPIPQDSLAVGVPARVIKSIAARRI